MNNYVEGERLWDNSYVTHSMFGLTLEDVSLGKHLIILG